MSIKQSYAQNGFFTAKGLLKEEDFSKIESLLTELIQRQMAGAQPNSADWVEFAKRNPAVVTRIYDEMRDNDRLLELGRNRAVVDMVRQFIDKPLLYNKIPFRIDVPFETKELAYWHQDDFYVKGNDREVTVWIPLYDTRMQHGCLSVMPGSHQLGKIAHTLKVGKKNLPEGIYDREVLLVEMERGDALFFSSFLVHSSTLNFSDRIRYSIQLRYTSGDLSPSQEMKGTTEV